LQVSGKIGLQRYFHREGKPLIAIAAFYGFKLEEMYNVSAFFNANVEEKHTFRLHKVLKCGMS